jgi:signal transduction histidine kinase
MTESAVTPPPFRLTRWFSLLSLVCVVSASTLLAYILSGFLTEQLLQREATVTQEFVQSVVVTGGVEAAFLASHGTEPGDALQHTFQHYVHIPDVIRTNVYSHDRYVIWSTEPRLAGRVFPDNDELDEALAGRLVFKNGVAHKDEHSVDAAPLPNTYFIEIYVPIWDPDKKRVVGVVEIYKTPRPLAEAIKSGRQLIWTVTSISGLFIYLALIGLVRRADRIMREQRQRLVETESLAAVGEMAGAVAHAIRNPLSAIRTSAELALDSDSELSREQAEDITAEVDLIEQSVRELLTYSRPHNARFESVELNEIIGKTVTACMREISARGIEVVLSLDERLPAVKGDAALLGQVFSSLIANSLDAMARAGQLTVISQTAADGVSVDIRITDTGSGIQPEDLDKIFRPFHTTKAKGLGLGLPLARRIIDRLGGTIAVTSRPGAGTTVHMKLLTI